MVERVRCVPLNTITHTGIGIYIFFFHILCNQTLKIEKKHSYMYDKFHWNMFFPLIINPVSPLGATLRSILQNTNFIRNATTFDFQPFW